MPLRLHALPGLGDAIHARGILPALMFEREVWFDTPHRAVYHDMPTLHFGHEGVPRGAPAMTCGYHPNHVKRAGSVLGAMAQACGVTATDFRLPIRSEWDRAARRFLTRAGYTGERPLAIFRPLVEVAESTLDNANAKRVRNPDPHAYAALFAGVRARYFVVAVANCQPGKEWLVGPQIEPDADCTHGELDFGTLAALFGLADLVFCPPGFAVVLAQAVETPCVTIFGGFEDARSFSAGRSPWLPIEPITPCACWSHECRGDKTIDLIAALTRIEAFLQ